MGLFRAVLCLSATGFLHPFLSNLAERLQGDWKRESCRFLER
jgi:hypothetical protein